MAMSLTDIENKAKIMKDPLVIDLTQAGGNCVEYFLTGAEIINFEEQEEHIHKKFFTKAKTLLLKDDASMIRENDKGRVFTKLLEKIGEEEFLKFVKESEQELSENYFYSHKLGITKEELIEYFKTVDKEEWEFLYKMFLSSAYDEFLEKVKSLTGK